MNRREDGLAHRSCMKVADTKKGQMALFGLGCQKSTHSSVGREIPNRSLTFKTGLNLAKTYQNICNRNITTFEESALNIRENRGRRNDKSWRNFMSHS